MKSGIYALKFKCGDTYIGQSRDIYKRWEQHFKQLNEGTHTAAMQDAWARSNKYVDASILIEVHPDLLDLYENYFINTRTPSLNKAIPGKLGEREYEILEKLATDDNASMSVPDIINIMYKLKAVNDINVRDIKELKNDLEKAKIGALGTDLYIELSDLRGQVGTLREDLENSQNRMKDLIEKIDAMPWWGRLFRMWHKFL